MMPSEDEQAQFMKKLDDAQQSLRAGRYATADTLIAEVKANTAYVPQLKRVFELAETLEQESRKQQGLVTQEAREGLDRLLNTTIPLPPLPIQITYPEHGEQALNNLEDDLDKILKAWEQQATEYLNQWRSTLASSADDTDLQYFERRVRLYAPEVRRTLYVQAIQRVCDNLIEHAKTLMKPGSTVQPATVLGYYDAAQFIVRDAAGKEPRLTAYKEAIENLRVERARANIVYTSAVIGGFYADELTRLRGLPPDTPVPRSRFTADDNDQQKEIHDDYISVEAAITDLEQRARDWANNLQLPKYLDEADTRLREHNPHAAETTLETDSHKVLPFLFPDNIDRLDDKLSEIRAVVEKYDRANDLAAEALGSLNDTPPNLLTAWQTLERARAEYPKADRVKEAEQAMRAHIASLTSEWSNQANNFFEVRDLNKLQVLASAVRQKYGVITENTLQDGIKALETRQMELQSVLNRKLTAANELLRIKSKANDGDGSGAAEDLMMLRQQYSDIISELINQVNEVEAIISRCLDIKDALRGLEAFKSNAVLEEVSGAVERAHALLKRSEDSGNRAVDQLRSLITYLETHAAFLKGKRAEGLKQYETALEYYRIVIQYDHYDDYSIAKQKADELDKKQDEDVQFRFTINEIRGMLDRDPTTAFQRLQNITPFDEVLAKEVTSLRIKARSAALSQIEARMATARDASPIPVEQVNKDLDALRKMQYNTELGRWGDLFSHAIDAQSASLLANEQSTNRDQLRSALKLWRDAIEKAAKVNAKELDDYRRKESVIERRFVYIRMEWLRAEIRKQDPDSPHYTTEIDMLNKDIDRLISQDPGDGDLSLWQAQLSEAIARYSMTPKIRQEEFTRARDFAVQAESLSTNPTARRLSEVARKGIQSAEVMATVDRYLTSSRPEDVAAAVKLWETALETSQGDEYWEPIGRWWKSRTGLSDEGGFFLPDGSLNYNKLHRTLLFAPSHPEAVRLLENIGRYIAQDIQRARIALLAVPTAEGVIPTASGRQRLERQLSEISLIVTQFDGITNLKAEFAKSVPVLTSTQLNDYVPLKTARDNLRKFLENLVSSNEKLIQSKRTNTFSEVRASLTELSATTSGGQVQTFREHPAYKEFEKLIQEAESERASLLTAMGEVQDAIDNGCYRRALDRLLQIAENKASDYGLRNSLTMTEPKTRMVLRDWDLILGALRQLIPDLDVLFSKGEEFGIVNQCADGSTDNGKTLPKTYLQVLINWETSKETILDLVSQGNFTEAHRSLNAAESENTGSTLALKRALSKLERLPLPAGIQPDADTAAERFRLAQEFWQYTPAALDVLDQLAQKVTSIQNNLEDVETLRVRLDDHQHEWNQGKVIWDAAMVQLAELFDELKGGVRTSSIPRKNRANFQSVVDEALKAYNKCKLACPKNDRQLSKMIDEAANKKHQVGEGQYLYWRARELLR